MADGAADILSQIVQTPSDSLTAELASRWLVKLDDAIVRTKQNIRDQVALDGPDFTTRLERSRKAEHALQRIQIDLQLLSENVRTPETSLVDALSNTMHIHSQLHQELHNSNLAVSTISLIDEKKQQVARIRSLAFQGDVIGALNECNVLAESLNDPSISLAQMPAFQAIKHEFRIVHDLVTEQLRLVFDQSIVVINHQQDSRLIVHATVHFPNSTQFVPLKVLLECLERPFMQEQERKILKVLISNFIVPIAAGFVICEMGDAEEDPDEHRLVLRPAAEGTLGLRIDSLLTLVSFTSQTILSSLPEPYKTTLSYSFFKEIVFHVIASILEPQLPTTLDEIPPFLVFLDVAVKFERQLQQFGSAISSEIKDWTDEVGFIFERRRSEHYVSVARQILSQRNEASSRILDESEETNDVSGIAKSRGNLNTQTGSENDDLSWGFDEVDGSGEVALQVERVLDFTAKASQSENDDDGWGWDENWEGNAVTPSLIPDLDFPRTQPQPDAKNSQDPTPNINVTTAQSIMFSDHAEPSQSHEVIQTPVGMLVSARATSIASLVRNLVEEGDALAQAPFFGQGTILYETCPLLLDLLRAFYHNDQHESSTNLIQQYCDVQYLRGYIHKLNRVTCEHGGRRERDRWIDTSEKLQMTQERLLNNAIGIELENIKIILSASGGFRNIDHTPRHHEIELVMRDLLSQLQRVAVEWKAILLSHRYLTIVGILVNAVLFHVMDAILSLQDITELESERLSGVCRMLESLSELFLDTERKSQIGQYVVLWFKFQYLGELLTASLADITYLFEEGMLVDFEVDEVVKLVCALFADTPLRANTIRRMEQGHPNQ